MTDPLQFYGLWLMKHLAVLGVCSLRLYAIMTLFPPTADGVLQGRLRNGVALSFTLFVAIAQPESFAESLTGMTVVVTGLRETLIGVVMGFAAATVFWVVEGAGIYLDNLTGYNNAQLSNPMISQQSTPSATLLGQIATVAFWSLGGMTFLLEALYESYRWWPVSSTKPMSTDFLAVFAMHQTDTLMQTIAKLAAPMLLVLLLIDLGVNLASKAAQKLDLSVLSQPIKGAVTVLMLAIFTGLFVHQVQDQLDLRLFKQEVIAIAHMSDRDTDLRKSDASSTAHPASSGTANAR
ncbi:type III secretion system export apparatus subunit SctT [Burkholderia metallica]|uniref:type III secretion system export apparatus subunit SctT n=1 Tax=Burkholderia metallica TaxID=488729 RepID=UPI001CF2DA8D|nr:type III secretion system export apparatus subunit SctT [Burkholderia metallica]MCA8002719.1 type III secretion system export apparatus subunit SctT [Burkholderia metallica]